HAPHRPLRALANRRKERVAIDAVTRLERHASHERRQGHGGSPPYRGRGEPVKSAPWARQAPRAPKRPIVLARSRDERAANDADSTQIRAHASEGTEAQWPCEATRG